MHCWRFIAYFLEAKTLKVDPGVLDCCYISLDNAYNFIYVLRSSSTGLEEVCKRWDLSITPTCNAVVIYTVEDPARAAALQATLAARTTLAELLAIKPYTGEELYWEALSYLK